ncbi:hypothetical protein Ancab_008545 [Ancistrocladus abbreviatus]
MAIANVADKSRGEKAMASQSATDYKASQRIEASAAKSDNNQKLIFALLLLLFDAILVPSFQNKDSYSYSSLTRYDTEYVAAQTLNLAAILCPQNALVNEWSNCTIQSIIKPLT